MNKKAGDGHSISVAVEVVLLVVKGSGSEGQHATQSR